MKVIMVMYDSLNRHFLPPYGCDWVHAPNFSRLAENSVVFDNCYAGSLPCMPARRELHTGRYSFLHRSWGPIEPFDDSMPELLKKKGVYTHLVSDHYHYWEDGGCTYHNRYSSWELSRGQEGDLWKGEVRDPNIPEHVKTVREGTSQWRHDWTNRKYMKNEEDQPQDKTFRKGLEFIDTNRNEDNWFLHIETFDPHEPFFTQQKYKDLYKHDYKGPHFDWPNYSIVTETPEQVEHCRKEYAASVSMCDYNLGRVLDLMDKYDLWQDTMLIVNTDHGFMLGEKNWWAKMIQPIYNEISHIPLFIWDPRSGIKKERRNALVQTIDLAPTIIEFFNVKRTKDMQGKTLRNTIQTNEKLRDYALFGTFGGHVNITDGRFVYMRAPVNPLNKPIYEYTIMPTHMSRLFSVNELKTVVLAEPFSFTKGCKTMKIECMGDILGLPYMYGSYLFDLRDDLTQEDPIYDKDIEKNMISQMVKLMKENDAPPEQYERLEIPMDGNVNETHFNLRENRDGIKDVIGNTEIVWKKKGKSMYYLVLSYVPQALQHSLIQSIEKVIKEQGLKEVNEDFLRSFIDKLIPKEFKNYIDYIFLSLKQKAK